MTTKNNIKTNKNKLTHNDQKYCPFTVSSIVIFHPFLEFNLKTIIKYYSIFSKSYKFNKYFQIIKVEILILRENVKSL